MSVDDVSIIIPIYATDSRHVDYFGACLGSCMSQSHDIVVVDDGSQLPYADQLYDISYEHKARYFWRQHLGKSSSRNFAVSVAERDLILPVDADDWIDEHAVEEMLKIWNANGGIPVYSDITRVHPGDSRQYDSLPSFNCEEALVKCIASVSVLHSVEQWKEVGGWDVNRNLYEDWVYNAKLLWTFCGEKIPKPLLYYRQHDLQSTSTSVESSGTLHNAWVSAKLCIEEFAKGASEMACCGKRRSSTSTAPAGRTLSVQDATVRMATQPPMIKASQSVDLSVVMDLGTLGDPGPGKVWARYLGGRGLGPHDKRLMHSRSKKRVTYGDIVSIPGADAVTKAAFEAGAKNCGFVAIENSVPTPEPRPAGAPPVVERKAPPKVERVPVEPETLEDDIKATSGMSIRELRNWLDGVELSLDQMNALLTAEKAGPNRIGAVRLYSKRIATMSD